MKKLSKNLLLVIGLSLAGASAAQAQQEGAGSDGIWSLEEAVNYARIHNLQVRQAKFNVEANDAIYTQSRFARLPSVNSSSSYSINTGTNIDPATYDLRTQTTRSSSLNANASLPLFMGFQLVNTVKQNALELQASQQDLLSAQNDITIQIVTAYLNILFANELINTSTLQRDLTNQQLDRTRVLFRAGSVAENAVLDLESQLATDELNLINAQNQRDISRLTLKQTLNLPAIAEFQIEIPEIPEPDQSPVLVEPGTVYEVALQTLPAIKAADIRVISAAKAIDIARGSYFPRLSVSAGVNTFYSSRSYLYGDAETTITGYNRQLVGYLDESRTQPFSLYIPQTQVNMPFLDYSLPDQFRDNIGRQVAVSLQIPIFNGFQTRTNVARAKIAQNNSKLNADVARNNLLQTIEQAYVDAVAAQRRYVAAKQQITAAEKNYRNAELRLNAGVINTIEFNTVANTFRSAQSSLIQAKYEYAFKLKVLDFYQGKDISF
ncbi:TolC family protein [Pontibacter harenae]|uniref:TolC family protein n=1 Tax=Pontibacter harenae TaxID=2894083 RepID=UPI001E6470D4|nr:TolC family protein [Pontibacter harenae]MCC9167065.1 TolC family protein [Pontibacter harenae]